MVPGGNSAGLPTAAWRNQRASGRTPRQVGLGEVNRTVAYWRGWGYNGSRLMGCLSGETEKGGDDGMGLVARRR